jgi:hypothetical protein
MRALTVLVLSMTALLETVYKSGNRSEPIFCARPSVSLEKKWTEEHKRYAVTRSGDPVNEAAKALGAAGE